MPRILCGLTNNVEIILVGVPEIVKEVGLAEPETMEREEHLDGFSFRFNRSSENIQTSYQALVGAFVCFNQVKVIRIGKRDYGRVVKFKAKF